MYIPPKYHVTDWQEITSFVSRMRAGQFITVNGDGTPAATLLPFTWYPPKNDANGSNKYGLITTHMAKANEQWREITNGSPALIVVQGPQAYISPTHYKATYETGKEVGTWNYQAVHLRGTVEVIHDPETLMNIVVDLQNDHESHRPQPWDVGTANQDFLQEMIKHIVGFTVKVHEVEAKFKLNQSYSEEERSAIIADLEKSDLPTEKDVASEMKRLFHKKVN